MTAKRKKRMTLAEHDAHLKATGEYDAMVARQEAQEAKRKAWSAVLIASSEPVLADLRAAGFEVETISDLFNRSEPWRKDVPIRPYPEAIPILLQHLGRRYHFTTNEEIVRALTCPAGRVAFDRLVDEFRRTANPEVAGAEKKRGAELVLAGVGDLYTREEVDRITGANWDSYRFATANAIVYHFQEEHIPVLVDLIRYATGDREEHWKALAEAIRKKMRRWRRKDPEILALLESLGSG